jgi:Zn-dependent peptidase ImmA (M78 family)
MHRDQQTSLFCRHASVDPEEGESGPRKREPLPLIEQEANHFAAALLMPRPMIESRYRSLSGREDCFPKLCEAFGVSGAAMSRRLRQVIPPGGPRPTSSD